MSEVKQKYLKDENGEIFSPIVSSESVYFNNSCINEQILNRLPKPKVIYTGSDNNCNGLLVNIQKSVAFQMYFFRIYGNGYSIKKPFETLIQGYFYNDNGSKFINCKQSNISENIDACSFGVLNGNNVLWIPKFKISSNTYAPYVTYIIECYGSATSTICNDVISIYEYSKPTLQYETICTL